MRVCLLVLLLSLLWQPAGAAAVPDAAQLLPAVPGEQVNQFIRRVNQELNADLPVLTPAAIKDIAAAGLGPAWRNAGAAVMAALLGEMPANARLLGKLMFLAVLCAMLQNLHSAFAEAEAALLSYSVCFIFMMVMMLRLFSSAVALASQTVGYMVGFMEAMLPLLLSLLAGAGAITTAALLTPLMLAVVSGVSIIVKDTVLPLLLLTAVLDCLNCLAGRYSLNNLAKLLKQSGLAILGFTLALFIGVITIQGVAGSTADSLALRTAKFAAASFVPVVGKTLADSAELVMGASLLIKNAAGIFGVILVSLLCLLPLVKLTALIVMIKLAGALIQPLGEEKTAACLDTMGNNLLLVLGAVIIVAIMFFLTMAMIIAVGSGPL